ncbi:Leucine-rich repeat protein soc-2 homolog [Camponotus japonicus]
MTVQLKLKDVKDKLKDDTLDLSLYELEEVPVREIASLTKATNVNLSLNLLVSLPTTFVTLRQIVKLDLSRNMLIELPENFGEMTQLKYLDLYANKISRLPLSLSELKNLRWLDLKENPLTEAVASVAGSCSNMSECQACARNIVTYLSTIKLYVEEERLRRLKDLNKRVRKKLQENKKKKKKNVEKEYKSDEDKINSQTEDNSFQDNNDDVKLTELLSDNMSTHESHKSWTGTGLRRFLVRAILWFFIISLIVVLFFVCLMVLLYVHLFYLAHSMHYVEIIETFVQNAQTLSGLPFKEYYRYIMEWYIVVLLQRYEQLKPITEVVDPFLLKIIQNNTNNAGKEL